MRIGSKLTGSLILATGMIIGILAVSLINSGEARINFLNTNDVVPAKDRQIRTLMDVNRAFTDIAESIRPTVVTVFTEKTVRMQNSRIPGFPFGQGDFFKDFFFDRDPQAPPKDNNYTQRGQGSGVIVSEDGYVITNNHVVQNVDSLYVRLFDERTFPAKVIGTDPRTDIALLRIEADKLNPIKLGDSDHLKVGEWVLAVGSPFGPEYAHTVTQGIVSAKGRQTLNSRRGAYEDFIQTDAAINPGNSGGAMVNLDGELVGINTAIITHSKGFEGIGLAIPINMARGVMESLLKHGRVVRGYLGIYPQDITDNIARAMDLKSTQGALVTRVMENSPAEKGGLKEDDIILSVNGKTVKDAVGLRNHVAGLQPGSQARIMILRNGKEKALVVQLGELPDQISSTDPEPRLKESTLGFSAGELSSSLAERFDLQPDMDGIVITSIIADSEAYRAGLRIGDLIRSVNRRSVKTISEFEREISKVKKGDVVLFKITRKQNNLYIAFNR